MKKIILVMPLLLLLYGCLIYGQGKQVGYVSAVENGIVWDKVYVKPTLESTQEDCYAFDSSTLKTSFENYMRNRQRVEITYYNHLVMLTNNCHYAEVYQVSQLGNSTMEVEIYG